MTGHPQLVALLATLDEHDVAYVVAGSVGAMAHGAADVVPGDLDVVPATDPANLARLRDALQAMGAKAATETGEWRTDEAGEHRWVEDGVERPPAPLDVDEAATFDHSFTTTALGRLDVVPRIAGSYAVLRRHASRLPIAGREAWVAHPIHLLAGMTGPRRPKDGPRVRHLRGLVEAELIGAASDTATLGLPGPHER